VGLDAFAGRGSARTGIRFGSVANSLLVQPKPIRVPSRSERLLDDEGAPMRTRMLAAVAVTAALVAGCGTTTQHGDHSADHRERSAMDMKQNGGMSMAGMHMDAGASHGRPSAAAAMICSPETASAVRRTFELGALPQQEQMWMPPVLGCTWALPHGSLDLAVDDATNPARGRHRFEQLRAAVPGAHELRGMASFGFPAFESPSGMVVFLKDGKVLSVDARRVPRRDLPQGFSREDVAYGVASAVIACWSE
jgi:hypothetical protein